MSVGPRMRKILLEGMVKHLPPSGATLRLLDVGGAAGEAIVAERPDVEVVADAPTPDTFDAVVVYGRAVDENELRTLMDALRPGGRLIAVDPDGEPNGSHVRRLEAAGYTRILVEPGMDCPVVAGVLMRGEKPHVTADTIARVQVAASHDDDITLTDLESYTGRFLHLLIRQTPNKPAWAIQPGESIVWEAAAIDVGGAPALLAFSSLPKAVAFMQPAVLNGHISDVSKVGKFTRENARGWRVLINPPASVLENSPVVFIAVDAARAEASDE